MLRPVNRLPPEILSTIARCFLDENAIDAGPIVPLTHVCRYWRESITLIPENWTLISTGRIELAAVSLERAKAARLNVDIDIRQLSDSGSFGPLVPYTQNIDTLHVCDLPGVEELTRAVPNFPRSTPNLRSLTLLCAYTHDKWDIFDPFESLTHPLKHLSLFNIPLYPSLLSLKTLTTLSLRYHSFGLQLDTLLTFLEQNRSLESATLDIRFTGPSLRNSRRRAAIKSRLRHLSISCNNPVNAQVLISNITLRKGAHLEISSLDRNTGLKDVLFDISTAHLSNLPSPAFMEYQSYPRDIRWFGPNGSFSFSCSPSSHTPLVELPLLSLTNIREFRLEHHKPKRLPPYLNPLAFDPSHFPALETLVVDCDVDLSLLLAPLLSNPASPSSLKTLAFLDCAITKSFMEELTQFAINRKDTASARLHHVVIVSQGGGFPTATSIRELGMHVPVVDVRFGTKLPTDLTSGRLADTSPRSFWRIRAHHLCS